MAIEKQAVFDELREILRKNSEGLTVTEDTSASFSVGAPTGPAAIAAWKGKVRTKMMPVAWVSTGKSYVSYHLMGIYMNEPLQAQITPALKKRMQGKTCFNFNQKDETLLAELSELTRKSIAGFRKGGFIL